MKPWQIKRKAKMKNFEAEGWNAWHAGAERRECPYMGEQATAWLKGFDIAAEEWQASHRD